MVAKDKKYRVYFNKQEWRLLKFKFLLQTLELSPLSKFYYYYKLHYKKVPTFSKIKNRCVLTHRGRASIRHTKMSRLAVRALGINGYLSGFIKFCF